MVIWKGDNLSDLDKIQGDKRIDKDGNLIIDDTVIYRIGDKIDL